MIDGGCALSNRLSGVTCTGHAPPPIPGTTGTVISLPGSGTIVNVALARALPFASS